MLEVNRLSTFYGQFQALKDVSINVAEAELVAIFGPNGHGKSTLLKTICGLLIPQSGTINYHGREIQGLATKTIVEMGLVYIPEDRYLFTELTILENLKLGAFNRNARSKEKLNLDYVFELFPRLRDWKNRQALTLSGGEARMLAIGRGLMSSPKFLAIDEPSIGLAPNLRANVFTKIKEINTSGIGKRTSLLDKNIEIVKTFRSFNKRWLLDSNLKNNDKIILSGNIGEHGIALMSYREGYGFETFNLKNFWATEAVLMMIGLVFHNLILYLNSSILNPNQPQEQLKTLRYKYFIIPGLLGNSGGKKILRMSVQERKMRSKIISILKRICLIPHNLNCIAVDQR